MPKRRSRQKTAAKTRLGLAALLLTGTPASAQMQTENETDPAVLRRIEWFRDQKFGLMMHWGPYSQWGIVESWSLCSEDEPWCQRTMDNYVEYCKRYEELPKTFNPVDFEPEGWAAAAKNAGMRYMVFTTKHHDGFSMFDTRQTDYRITDSSCPFHTHPRANVTKEIFAAFRKQGFGIGAYFSKPDWHSPWYWAPYWAHADRNVNYDIAKHPDKWKAFCEFTHKQIEELVSGYGPVDILWFDGGWVRPDNKRQDINMAGIAAMARSYNPGMLIVDRTVTGRYENYRTPEQEVPDKPLEYPWETCMTMGNSWSYVPHDTYKSASRLIHLLVDIVAKGGNFLLNIGPDPKGNLPPESLQRLEEIGEWMKVNSSAIYGTRPVKPYKEGKICFTQAERGAVYAVYLADESESEMPASIWLQSVTPRSGSTVRLLGAKEPLKWEKNGMGVIIQVPPEVRVKPPTKYAWVFAIEKPQK
jgi:alpha-L-fucosidase